MRLSEMAIHIWSEKGLLFLIKNCAEYCVARSAIVLHIGSSFCSSLFQGFAIGHESLHDGIVTNCITDSETSALGEQAQCLAECLMVRTEDYRNAIDSGFECIVNAYAKASADISHVTIAIYAAQETIPSGQRSRAFGAYVFAVQQMLQAAVAAAGAGGGGDHLLLEDEEIGAAGGDVEARKVIHLMAFQLAVVGDVGIPDLEGVVVGIVLLQQQIVARAGEIAQHLQADHPVALQQRLGGKGNGFFTQAAHSDHFLMQRVKLLVKFGTHIIQTSR